LFSPNIPVIGVINRNGNRQDRAGAYQMVRMVPFV
jgi:hypothetical protein